MKKSILVLALSALLVNTVACGSKEKKQDLADIPAQETTIQDTQASLADTAPKADESLGASSSGRGH